MEAARAPRHVLFRVFLVLGGVLALLLAIQSVRMYRYVTYRLVMADAERVATLEASYLQFRSRRLEARDPQAFQALLEDFFAEERKIFAWIRLLDSRGNVLAIAGEPVGSPIKPSAFPRDSDRMLRPPELRRLPNGEQVLVLVRPFRFRLTSQEAWTAPPRPSEPPSPDYPKPWFRRGPPEPNFLELAIYPHGMGTQFQELRGQVALSLLAALALLASMLVLRVRFEGYVRERQLEQQLALARKVQQDLLPSQLSLCEELDLAAACVPAWQVGGDFYDAFRDENGRVGLVIGDVSGKGIPAALLMALLHGAIRARHWTSSPEDLEAASQSLNELLRARTSVEHFATLFWCYYDPLSNVLCYVNAGHLPPLLVRRLQTGKFDVHRLDDGGPVLGVIAGASYRAGRIEVQAGDVLVLFSDGLVEATNEEGEEFGEGRLVELVIRCIDRSAAEIREAVLAEARRFVGTQPLRDDLTLLISRVVERAVQPESLATVGAAVPV